jgi:2-C-methyl-D-erythritol 4-phosphate cytidylyltransferase
MTPAEGLQATAVIAAAGSGDRLGAGGPKSLVVAADRPLIAWCVEAFAAAASVRAAVIAAPAGYEGALEGAAAAAGGALPITVVTGASSRGESVGIGLERVETDLVAVHDAARPLVTPELIEALIARLGSSAGADGVIAAAPVTDTIKRVADSATVQATEDREHLWAAQTPQLFRARRLRDAHAASSGALAEATDDAVLVERQGGTVLVEPAPAENLKVTTGADLRLAELLLAERERERPRTWIRRVMPNVVARDLAASRAFYADFLGLMVAMDEPGFLMLASPSHPTSELTVGSEEQREWDPETHRTTIAIEVADVDAVYAEARRLGLPVVYPLTDEPWGIRRFFVEDPDGTVINVHSHIEPRR